MDVHVAISSYRLHIYIYIPGAHRAGEAGEGACNSVYYQRRQQNSNMADFLLCLVSTVTIFSITILLWLKKPPCLDFAVYVVTCSLAGFASSMSS